MRKFLVWPDGHKIELSPISFKEYMILGLWGSSSESWDQWLRVNNYEEPESYCAEFLYKSVLVLEPGEPSLKFLKEGDEYTLDGTEFEDYNNINVKERSINSQKFPIKDNWDSVSEEQGADISSVSAKELTIKQYNDKWNLNEWKSDVS